MSLLYFSSSRLAEDNNQHGRLYIIRNNIGRDLCVFILSEFLDCEEEEEEGKWRHLREIRRRRSFHLYKWGGGKYSSAASSSSSSSLSLCVWLLLQDDRCAAEEVHILSQLLASKKERVGVKGALLYTWNYPRKERGEHQHAILRYIDYTAEYILRRYRAATEEKHPWNKI